MPFSPEDRRWMAQAIALATRARGSTAPNPKVGCVLVRHGVAVGSGLHRGAGTPHAEGIALHAAGERARGATAYVNLEPCAHHGRTPPCTDHLIAAGVTRVVAAIRDPDPRVDGRGFAKLEQSGIRVESGLLAREAERINAAFLHRHRHAPPLVTLKAALSLDGQIAAAGGESRWVTSPTARRVAHRLRLDHDALLVGAGTVRRDDPRLSIRLDGAEEFRPVVVLSRKLDLSARARLFARRDPASVFVFTGNAAPEASAEALADVATVVRVAENDLGLNLRAVLDEIAARDIQSVLVEGGGTTAHRFLSQGLAQRAALFHAPSVFGARGATPVFDGQTVDAPASGWTLARDTVLPIGPDQLILGRWVETSSEVR